MQNPGVKVIGPAIHGVLDYVAVVFLLLAPTLFPGLTGPHVFAAYGLALGHLALTVCTRFPAGLFGVVPLRVHGLIEIIVSIALIVAPWILGFEDVVARNLSLLFGVAVFVIWFVTDYDPAPRQKPNDTDRPEKSRRQDNGENHADKNSDM